MSYLQKLIDAFNTKGVKYVKQVIFDGLEKYIDTLDDDEINYCYDFLNNYDFHKSNFSQTSEYKKLVKLFKEYESFTTINAKEAAFGAWFLNSFLYDWCVNLGCVEELDEYLNNYEQVKIGFYEKISKIANCLTYSDF